MALESGPEVKEFIRVQTTHGQSNLDLAMSFHHLNEPQLVSVKCHAFS